MVRKKSSKTKKSFDNPGSFSPQILKLTENFGKLKGKVDAMDKNLSDNIKNLDTRVVAMHNSVKQIIEIHDRRILNLEKENAKIKGKVTGIALTVSLVIGTAGLLIAFIRAAF